MSIRFKILLPLLTFLAVAGALAALVGMRSYGAFALLSSLTERTATADEAARGAREQFERGEQLLARVLSMTDFVDAKTIEAEFERIGKGLGEHLSRLKDAALSDRVDEVAQKAQTEAALWRTDAEILLGVRRADAVPTTELMARHSRRMRQILDDAVALRTQESRARIAEAGANLTAKLWLLLVAGACAGLAGAGFAVWLAGSLSKPLVRLAADAGRLAEGDLAVALVGAGRRDEIGRMVAAVQVFRESLVRARALEADSEAARAGAEAQRKAATREMADGFERAVGGVIATVTASATEMQSAARAMSGTASLTAEESNAVAAAAGLASENVSTAAAAVEELGTSMGEISHQAGGSATLAHAAVGEAEQTATLVQDLNEAATKIGEVVALIQNIAAQTNLLALNATIEAARAGAAGRGFAVVAAEVKELAAQTARATEEITSQITRVQGSTGQAVTAIGNITGRIREISCSTASIAAAVEEQGVVMRDIVRSVGHAAQGAGDVTTCIGRVAGAAEATGAASARVLGSASALSEQADALKGAVDSFLTTVRAA